MRLGDNVSNIMHRLRQVACNIIIPTFTADPATDQLILSLKLIFIVNFMFVIIGYVVA